MAEVTFSPAALNDLEEINKYISEDSVYYAEKVIDRIVDRCSILNNNPMAGKVVREFQEEAIREILAGNYRVIYEVVDAGHLSILRIYHSARILKKL